MNGKPFCWLLIRSDGYSITTKKFDDPDAAYADMQTDYDNHNNNEVGDDWDEQSFINETDALLYDGGEDVYVWKIVAVV